MDHVDVTIVELHGHDFYRDPVFVVTKEEESLILLTRWGRNSEHETAMLDSEAASRPRHSMLRCGSRPSDYLRVRLP